MEREGAPAHTGKGDFSLSLSLALCEGISARSSSAVTGVCQGVAAFSRAPCVCGAVPLVAPESEATVETQETEQWQLYSLLGSEAQVFALSTTQTDTKVVKRSRKGQFLSFSTIILPCHISCEYCTKTVGVTHAA